MCNQFIRKKHYNIDIIDIVQDLRKSLSSEHNHFSVFVLGTKVLTVAHNIYTSCTHSPSIHSEISGIMKLNKLNSYKKTINQRDFLDVYNVRMNKNGTIGNSRPCKNCLEQMQRYEYFKFDKVYFTSSTGEFVCEKFSSMYDHPSTTISSGNRKRDYLYMLINTKALTAVTFKNFDDVLHIYGFASNQKKWFMSTLAKNGIKVKQR